MGLVGGSMTPPAWPFPDVQSGGENEKCPISGPGGYIAPVAWEVPNASDGWTESEVAHKWARWLHNPSRLGDPHRFRAGDRVNRG